MALHILSRLGSQTQLLRGTAPPTQQLQSSPSSQTISSPPPSLTSPSPSPPPSPAPAPAPISPPSPSSAPQKITPQGASQQHTSDVAVQPSIQSPSQVQPPTKPEGIISKIAWDIVESVMQKPEDILIGGSDVDVNTYLEVIMLKLVCFISLRLPLHYHKRKSF